MTLSGLGAKSKRRIAGCLALYSGKIAEPKTTCQFRHSRAGWNPISKNIPSKQFNFLVLSATRNVFLLDSRLRENDG